MYQFICVEICTTNMVDVLTVSGTWITVSVQLQPFLVLIR